MRQGIRVIDSDTHVNPSMDVLLRYADPPLRECMDDLAPYLRKVKVSPGRGDAEDQGQATILSIKQLRYSRVAGAKPSAPTGAEGDRGFLSARTHMVTRRPITARVADDNAGGRLADMDTEGRDIDFIIPGPWAYGAPALASPTSASREPQPRCLPKNASRAARRSRLRTSISAFFTQTSPRNCLVAIHAPT
jgi:hypothetical protein